MHMYNHLAHIGGMCMPPCTDQAVYYEDVELMHVKKNVYKDAFSHYMYPNNNSNMSEKY